ncbi:MAG: selenocysteine-specific translation elongation factor [candidate division Zixibacteria bacterium]|nr:selenocysteine-specific translation elongation factor [candidate division Zixibacteria bacterium]
MIVVGTAGHIDHGKSAIVKRLTGTDPDRLPEEKSRGMTIDLGFAFYDTPDGDQVAFVDVPGHERFVRNMIAGAGGIDVVLLVVAADDGWMPQSEEHFQVVRLLGVRSGIIVINKTDLVEKDWLDLLQQEIREKTAGSFLEDAPIIPVSAQTGDGFEQLRDCLQEISTETATRKATGKTRLYVDRSFVQTGIGTVVTGTLRGGDLNVGQNVTVWPSLETGKVRSLQSNNRDVKTATPGQRTAVSITGLDRNDLIRGGVVVGKLDCAYFRDNPVLALSVEMLKQAPVTLSDRRRALVIIGTSEVTGEIRLYDRKEITPGETGIVFFKPDEPLLSMIGDHFIARLPTPMVTIGGGRVIDRLPNFPRRKQSDRYQYLNDRLTGSVSDLVISELKRRIIAPSDTLLSHADYSSTELSDVVSRLKKDGVVSTFRGQLTHNETIEKASAELKTVVEEFLKGKPHLKGLSPDELDRLSPFDFNTTATLTEFMVEREVLARIGEKYDLAGRTMSLKGPVKQAYDDIVRQLRVDPLKPPLLSKLAAGGKQYREAIKYILESGEGYKCGSEFIFLAEAWDEIVGFVKQTIKTKSDLSIAELRDHFDFSRKFAVPILEETDRIRLTSREGDVRVRGDRFEN